MDGSPHRELLRWYRELIAFRKAHPDLQSPEAKVTYDQERGFFTMERPGVSVMCNFSTTPVALLHDARDQRLLDVAPGVEIFADHVVLPPNSVAVIYLPSDVEHKKKLGFSRIADRELQPV